jgi:uncharacterized protein (DUF58 family)
VPEVCSVPVRRALPPRPTRSAALLLLLAIILEVLGRLIHSTGVTIAAAAALGAIVGDVALVPRIDGLRLIRNSPSRFTVGTPTTVELTIQAPGRRWGVERQLVVIDTHPALPPGRVLSPSLAAGAVVTASREVVPPARGHWVGPATLEIEAYSPLGGFVRRWTLRYDSEVWVHPAPARPIRMPELSATKAVGTSAAMRSGQGIDVFGIREWRAGDPSSEIHWRATARRGQIVVREREQPAQTPLTVAAGTCAEGETWEIAVARATATAVSALRSGRAVVLLDATGANSPSTVLDILDWFAELHSDGDPAPAALHAASRSAGVGGTLLWIGATPIGQQLTHAARTGGAGAVVSLGPDHPAGAPS